MPTPIRLPFPPLVLIDQDGELETTVVERATRDRIANGVSLCVRSGDGPEKRGGYFFHLRQTRDGHLSLSTFDTPDVVSLTDTATLVAFMNHVAGRRYSEAMWTISQRLNLRTDHITASD